MRGLITEAGSHLIRKRFLSAEELLTAVYASLVKTLEERELLRFTPFDATPCHGAGLDDLDFEKISRFLGLARRARSFPLSESTDPVEVLTHLDLLSNGRPTHAALLLFGRKPQRFLIAYEIPQEVVAEAIVNAVVHRDYTSNASVQVMLFKDRLEIWNPGSLPPTLTLEKLKGPHQSVPANPLIAEPMYLTKYIERMGTGIRDMIDRCRNAGLPELEIKIDSGVWVTTIRRKSAEGTNGAYDAPGWHPVGTQLALSRHQVETLQKCQQDSSIGELISIAGRSDRTKFRNQVLRPLLIENLIEPTIPQKPTSSNQKYRLTENGRKYIKK